MLFALGVRGVGEDDVAEVEAWRLCGLGVRQRLVSAARPARAKRAPAASVLVVVMEAGGFDSHTLVREASARRLRAAPLRGRQQERRRRPRPFASALDAAIGEEFSGAGRRRSRGP